jgi:hypothetical protein
MRYAINVRMKNPGPAKYLIESRDSSDYMVAHYIAQHLCAKADKDHFVEIVDDNTGEQLACFNNEENVGETVPV